MENQLTPQIVLYGAGKLGLLALEHYSFENVRCFCDANEEKSGSYHGGKLVISPAELKKLAEEIPVRIVLSLGFEYFASATETLQKWGLEHFIDKSFLLEYDLRFFKEPLEFSLPENEMSYYSSPYEEYPHMGQESRREKYEIVRAKEIKEDYEYQAKEPVAIPIRTNRHSQTVMVQIGEERCDLLFDYARYNWFRVNTGERFRIKAQDSLIVGDPIPLTQAKNHHCRLHLMLFVDTFSAAAIESGLDALMPNTARFFHNGIQFTNCHSHAEWTLPGVSTMLTGKYPIEHQMLHPNKQCAHKTGSLITSRYHEAGYMTFATINGWRMAPRYGYVQDMDRMNYCHGKEEGTAHQMIHDVLEHLRAFPQRDHFIFLPLFDLHHLQKWLPSISQQLANGLHAHRYRDNTTVKSVFQSYNKGKTECYLNTAKNIDFYMEALYHYISEHYAPDEVVAFLACDHGVQYINSQHYLIPGEEEPMVLRKSISKVPFLVRAPGLNHEVCTKIAENRKIYNLMCHLLKQDGQNSINQEITHMITSEASYQESIFPGQTYQAVIYSEQHVFCFKTKNPVDDNCKIDLSSNSYALFNVDTDEDITEQEPELVKNYLQQVMDHCKLARVNMHD